MSKSNTKLKRMERDIAYCIDELNLTNEQIGEILRACEKLGNITVEYFCEEFIFDTGRISNCSQDDINSEVMRRFQDISN